MDPLHQSPSAAEAHFLIADDTPGKQHYLRALLKKSGFPAEAVIVRSTRESEDIIAKMPNIIGAFVDYRMPQAGGIAIVEMLRKTHPHARIALVTASTGDVLEQEARSAGADATISTAYPEHFVTERLLKLLEEWKETKK